MQFLTSLFGGSENIWLTAAFALGAVILLIVLLSWLLRLFGGGGARPGRGRNRRLAVVDSLVVDPKRTLLIVRRDDVEHLILTGGPGDLVVERGIPAEPEAPRPPNRRAAPTRPVEPAAPLPPAPAPANVTTFDRRPTQRHPGLLRPVPNTEPSLAPQPNVAPAANSGPGPTDSAMYETERSSEGRPTSADASVDGRPDHRTD